MRKFGRRNCITVSSRINVAVKGQTVFLVKVQGYFFILITLTKDTDQSTATINVPPPCDPTLSHDTVYS